VPKSNLGNLIHLVKILGQDNLQRYGKSMKKRLFQKPSLTIPVIAGSTRNPLIINNAVLGDSASSAE
jgi:hypothetical protein